MTTHPECARGSKAPDTATACATEIAEVVIASEAPIIDSVAQAAPPSPGVASSLPLFAANMLEAILPFVRNVALAHLISPTEFGLAITVSVVVGMIEIVTDLGLPVYAVRHMLPMDAAVTLGTLHTLAILRSAILGLALVLVAPYVAQAFQAPQATWAYAFLGLVCLVRGFENLGVKAAMRRYTFWREGAVIAASQIIGLVATLATAAATRDFACTMWGLLTSTAVTVALSHVLSPDRYRLLWNGTVARDVAAFGRPLLVNGMAVAASLSDRVVIGAVMSAPMLAAYNVAFGTAMLPRTVLVKFLTSVMLPRFVECRERNQDSRELVRSWTVALSALAFTYGLTLDLAGEQALRWVFGAAYTPSRLVMSLFAMSLSVKFMMLLPNPIAYAAGRTKIITLGSILAAAAILPGIVVLVATRSLPGFVLAMGLAECLMLAVFLRVSVRQLDFDGSIAWVSSAMPYLLLAPLAILCVALPTLPIASWALACLCVALLAALAYRQILRWYDVELSALSAAGSGAGTKDRTVRDDNFSVLDYRRS